jgi:hypothetical protein
MEQAVIETSRRDGAGANGAASTELEARIVVLEIIAMTSLALALDTTETNGEHARGIATLILDTIRQRSQEFGLNENAQQAANDYAEELLSTALVSLYPG